LKKEKDGCGNAKKQGFTIPGNQWLCGVWEEGLSAKHDGGLLPEKCEKGGSILVKKGGTWETHKPVKGIGLKVTPKHKKELPVQEVHKIKGEINDQWDWIESCPKWRAQVK